ncbi:MAG: hypothetical protein V7K89_21560 [Nostoc sp.]|uniref:hypothetical protein n=1 Tax=Nostoc sp. TaxID=1180 RepID=UPI002FFBFB2F
MTTQQTIAATNPSSSSPGITVTLESTGIFLGILVSASILAGLGFKIVSSVSKISSSISQIEEDLKDYSKSANSNAQQLTEISHRLDLHVQDYVNRKNTITLLIGGIKETMEHRTNRLYTSMKDMESYLQKHEPFKIREFQDLHKMEEDNPFDKI